MKKDIVKMLNEHDNKLKELEAFVDELIKKEYTKTSLVNENDDQKTLDFKEGFDASRLIFLQELKKIKERIPKV